MVKAKRHAEATSFSWDALNMDITWSFSTRLLTIDSPRPVPLYCVRLPLFFLAEGPRTCAPQTLEPYRFRCPDLKGIHGRPVLLLLLGGTQSDDAPFRVNFTALPNRFVKI